MKMSNSFLLISLVASLFSFACSTASAEPSAIVGHWFFYKKIYQNHEMPEPPTATLRMYFEFSESGESLLYWWHEGESDFCRRRGTYTLEEGVIVDKIVWLDPKNTRDCSSDPDMQLGRTTRTPYYFHKGELAIRFHLGDEPLDFVWKKVEEDGK